jgi:hypothetical protein
MDTHVKNIIDSAFDYDNKIYELFRSVNNVEDLQLNIFEFFNKYPTKKMVRCPDGTIININPDEPAVNIHFEKLPVLDGIPQGEEATRMILRNVDSGVIISSPPGVINTYFITRYGSPLSYTKQLKYDDYVVKPYNDLRKYCPINIDAESKICFLHKFKCNSSVNKLIIGDFDSEIYSCEKHQIIISSLINMNVALIYDINLFLTDDSINKYAYHNYSKKYALLKKVKLTLKLAEMGKLLDKQLDSDFILRGIHYYSKYVDCKQVYGWALLYHNSNNKIAHIYLDQISKDIEVIKTIQLFAYEIIHAKHYNDLPHVETYMKYQKKQQYTQLEKVFKKPYVININHIISNNMIH